MIDKHEINDVIKSAIDTMMQRAIDGELSAHGRQKLDEHLLLNPDDAERFAEMLRQSDLVKRSIPVPSSAHLRGLKAKATETISPRPVLRIAASIAIFVVGTTFGYTLPGNILSPSHEIVSFAQHAREAHSLYVSEVMHPVEVAASEKDHLQTWLSNRLGAPIVTPQISDAGFELIGGRLLPIRDQATALFMYENENGDRLSLVATHGSSPARQSFRFNEAKGFLSISWSDGPWQYSLVGSLERDPLDQIARKIHEQLM